MKDLTNRMINAVDAHKGVMRPAIVQLMAEAWEEGRASGIDECAGDRTNPANPYKAADV